jgi:hypothetical protein
MSEYFELGFLQETSSVFNQAIVATPVIHALSFDLEVVPRRPACAVCPQPSASCRRSMRSLNHEMLRRGARHVLHRRRPRDPRSIAELAADGRDRLPHDDAPQPQASLAAEFRTSWSSTAPRRRRAAWPASAGFRAPMFSSISAPLVLAYCATRASLRQQHRAGEDALAWRSERPAGHLPRFVADPGRTMARLPEFPLTACALGPVRIPTSGGVFRLIRIRLCVLPAASQGRVHRHLRTSVETYPARCPTRAVHRALGCIQTSATPCAASALLSDFSFAPVREVLDL